MDGVINDNSFLKVEGNKFETGLVPHITINNGRSELIYNDFIEIKSPGITLTNGSSEVTIKSENLLDQIFTNYNLTENLLDQNFPNYTVGYTAEFRNIINSNQFSTNYNNSPYFTSVLLNDGNKSFWSELNDGYVLKDFSCELSSLYVYHSISNENLKIYNFNKSNITEETTNSIQLTNCIPTIVSGFSTNDYISDQYGHIYKIDSISNNYTSMKLLLNGEKYIFNIIPKNLNGHTININFTDEIQQELTINNFENGYINLSGNSINAITNISNNNSEITFDNINFKNNISGLNCNNLTFNNCEFTANVAFDNCNVKISSCIFNSTLLGVNNSQIYVKDSISTQTLKCQGLSNSQITWTSDNLINNNYKSYIARGNVNLDLSGLISSSLYSGVELTNQNALVNHFHKYPEYLIPNQYITTDGTPSSYLDTLPIGSVIFWPEVVRKRFLSTDTEIDIKNRNINYILSSEHYVCVTPLLTGAYQRCNGEDVYITETNKSEIISALIGNKFGMGNTCKVPNLVSGHLSGINDDKFDEVYPMGYYTFGTSFDDTLSLKYVMRWASGIGQLHNGACGMDQEVRIDNTSITMRSRFSDNGRKRAR